MPNNEMDYSLIHRTPDGNGKILVTTPGSPDKGSWESEAELKTYVNQDVNTAINAINTRVTNIEETLMGENEVTVQYPSDSTYSSLMPNRVPSRALKFAEVPRLMGKSRSWNQLVQNGNFSSGTSGWSPYNYHTSISASDGVLTQTLNETDGQVFEYGLNQDNVITSQTNKHLICFTVEVSFATKIRVELGGSLVYDTDTLTPNTKYFICAIVTPSIYNKNLLIYPLTIPSTTGNTIKYQNIFTRDLTLIFPDLPSTDLVTSNIPNLVKRCPDLLKYDAYDAGSLVDTVVSGVKAVGVSICPPNLTVGYYVIPNGYIADTDFKTSDAIPVKLGKTYIGGFYDLSDTLQGGVVYTTFANDTDTVPIRQVIDDTITIQSGENYVRIRNYSAQTPFVTSNNCKYQLEEGSTRTTFHPYKSDTLSLSEPLKLRSAGYGDTEVAEVLTLDTGKKTRPIKELTFDADTDWQENSGVYYLSLSDGKVYPVNLDPSITFSDYEIVGTRGIVSFADKTCSIVAGTSAFAIRDDSYANLSAFKAGMVGKKFTYALATPLSDEQVCDPIPDNYIEVQADGTVETIQTQTPVIDNCLDVTYDIIPQ